MRGKRVCMKEEEEEEEEETEEPEGKNKYEEEVYCLMSESMIVQAK